MSSSCVTLAEVLQLKGAPLEEEEIWALLHMTTEHLLQDLPKDPLIHVICPWSMVLSAGGSLSFQDNVFHPEAAPFRAPELLHGQSKNKHAGLMKMLVYSLGMTLYWSADYQVPPNQSLQLSDQLHGLLLMLCEDLPHKRLSPQSILEACEVHQRESSSSPPRVYIQGMVKSVLGSITEVDQVATEDSQLNRSHVIRKRLHEKASESSALPSQLNFHQGARSLNYSRSAEDYRQLSVDYCDSSSISESTSLILSNRGLRRGRAPQAQREWDPNLSGSRTHGSYKLFINRSASTVDKIPAGAQKKGKHNLRSLGSTFSVSAKDSLAAAASLRCVFQRKEKFSGPEFIILSSEPPVTLQLPGSIVTKKGKSYLSQRDLTVILLNGQCLEVKCDIKSKVRDVFNTVVAYANLVEHFYFGLAYLKEPELLIAGKEFFFLDDETKLYKVAPEGWNDQPKKKTSIINFTLFLRIKFFVSHFTVIQHGLTRHQFYLQLRKDILEERLYCNDEISLQLGALALQAELGNYAPEVHGKNYFRVEDYVPASRIEKMTLACTQRELAKLHRMNHSLFEDEAELEFLRVTQQLPEYGVLFHRVSQEKKTAGGGTVLGICAKGIIVYEMKNCTRIARLRFQWREMERISAHRKKFMIESSFSGKKYTFVTDTAKMCKYLLDLCSAQHKFNAQMHSRQLRQASSEDSKFMEIDKSNSVYAAQYEHLALIQRLSRSENVLYGTNVENTSAGMMSKSCDNLSVKTNNGIRDESNLGSSPSGLSQSEVHLGLNDKRRSYDYLSIHSTQNTASTPGSPISQRENALAALEREIICVTLKRDPKNGFGFVIIGGENVGKLDLGIFIASIIPGGPADRAGHIKPGGRLISVNNVSLEGVSFNTAVKIIQNSPDEVELIISQPKDISEEGLNEEKNLSRKTSTSGSEISCADSGRKRIQDCHTAPSRELDINTDELEKVLSWNLAPKLGPKIPVLSMGSLDMEEANSSHFPPSAESNSDEVYSVELVKEDGSFGISVTGGINTSVRDGGIYVKSIIPKGPADKDGQIKKGDRLLEVDGVSLCGITHKQAVECLKKSGQVARLVLERGRHRSAEPCPAAKDGKEERCEVVSLATPLSDSPNSYSFTTDGSTFEVKLMKNSGGLGFSFLQMERDACEHLGGEIVRIKRLFPGQPAAENGEIEVGDVILAVNEKPIQGLSYQDVLHLLRGAPRQVTLLLCRPPKGVLPEIDQSALTPVPSPVKEFGTVTPATPEPSSGVDHAASERDSTSPELEDHMDSQVVTSCGDPSEEENLSHEEQDTETPEEKPRAHCESSHKHLWKFRQEAITSETFLSLEEEVRQNCYSPYESRRAESPVCDGNDSDLSRTYCVPDILSPTPVDEEYLTLSSVSLTSLSCGRSSQTGSTLIATPQPRGPFSASSPAREPCNSDNEWEDLEELEGEEKEEEYTRETEVPVTVTRSANNGYGFTVALNNLDNCLYVESALSDGRLRRGDRLIMVNGVDVTAFSYDETQALLHSSPPDLSLVVGRVNDDPYASVRPDEIPEITLTKGSNGQLGLKLTGGAGSKLQGIYVLEVVPGSPASIEGSLQPRDQIVSICGLWTEGISLDDAVRVCEAASCNVHIKATRNGNPVVPREQQNWPLADPEEVQVSLSNENRTLQEQHRPSQHTKHSEEESCDVEQSTADSADSEDCIINIELEKTANGNLGFALVGGRNGRAILIKAISQGSIADLDGRLQVGDILLKVNENLVSGLTRNTVIDLLRTAQGTVRLTVCRSAALHWAYSGNQCNTSSLQSTATQPDEPGGGRSLEAKHPFAFRREEEDSSQMCSKHALSPISFRQDSENKCSSPLQGQSTELDYQANAEKSQQYLGCAGSLRTNSQESETDSWMSEEDVARRISIRPRGSSLVSEDELTQLTHIVPSPTGVGLRSRLRALIQSLRRQIEEQEILKEFVALEHLKPLDGCQVGKAPENREKNRYRDILPYDATRVPLGASRGYINASYIRMHVGGQEHFYISTQGPLPCTVADFWQMVWENESDVIAMMTKEVELGKVKCHRYWPEPPEDSLDVAEFHLRLDNYQILEYFIIRIIEIINKQTGESRFVRHLQFTTWPDHGTPRLIEHLVKFIRYMRKVHQTGPITAHCSAGIGRSGVLLCIDILLSCIEKDLCFNIKETVRELRHQRFGMVQTRDQYLFCYEVVLEVLQNMEAMESQLLQ